MLPKVSTYPLVSSRFLLFFPLVFSVSPHLRFPLSISRSVRVFLCRAAVSICVPFVILSRALSLFLFVCLFSVSLFLVCPVSSRFPFRIGRVVAPKCAVVSCLVAWRVVASRHIERDRDLDVPLPRRPNYTPHADCALAFRVQRVRTPSSYSLARVALLGDRRRTLLPSPHVLQPSRVPVCA